MTTITNLQPEMGREAPQTGRSTPSWAPVAIDCTEIVPVSEHVRKILPYVAVMILAGLTILMAVSCKGSTVLFRTGDKTNTLQIETSDTEASRTRGLMGRASLPADSGMLFDFGRDVSISFYMRDTRIPLSIAFIDSSGHILAIRNMKPFDVTPVAPPGRYRYAIEVNRGWFASHDIKPGSSALIDL